MRCAMRRDSTVVLPVPAPATTSIGTCTCSIACRCSGVAINPRCPLLLIIGYEQKAKITLSGLAQLFRKRKLAAQWCKGHLTEEKLCDPRVDGLHKVCACNSLPLTILRLQARPCSVAHDPQHRPNP